MNRHLGLFSHALIGGLLLFATAVATQAQTTAPAIGGSNLDAIKTAPATPANVSQINDFINARVQAITGSDVQAAQAARDQLIDAVSPGKVAPGPGFLNQFAVSLDPAIAPALKHQSYSVRMNAGIVIARVAQLTDDAALVNATQTLLNDQSNFVALWGLKSARWVLPALLRNPAANPNNLISGILKAVSTHGSGPVGAAVVAEAYDALSIDAIEGGKRKPTPASLAKVIPAMQQLLGLRVAAYKSGIPPEPLADQKGTGFLAYAAVWSAHTPPQKVASMQLMSNLVGLAAQQTAAAAPAEKDSLTKMIGLVVSAMSVVPEMTPLQAQLQPATKINANTQPQQIMALVAPIPGLLKGVKGFESLTPPPAASTGGPVAAGTQPSAAAASTTTTAGKAPTSAP